jgi:hypothetical protein
MAQGKLGILPKWRPTGLMLCLDSIWLMQLKVVVAKGTKVTEVGFPRGRETLFSGLIAHQICWSV